MLKTFIGFFFAVTCIHAFGSDLKDLTLAQLVEELDSLHYSQRQNATTELARRLIRTPELADEAENLTKNSSEEVKRRFGMAVSRITETFNWTTIKEKVFKAIRLNSRTKEQVQILNVIREGFSQNDCKFRRSRTAIPAQIGQRAFPLRSVATSAFI